MKLNSQKLLKTNMGIRIEIIVCIIFLINITSFAQTYQNNDISIAKIQLEELQNRIWQIEQEGEKKQNNEINRLQQLAETNDEFETTKQFEERRTKTFDKISTTKDEIEKETKQKINSVLQQINIIQRSEYIADNSISLGQYNADNQVFPLMLNNGNYKLLFVPLTDAKNFKDFFRDVEINAKVGLILDENNKASEYLIYATAKFQGEIYYPVENLLNIDEAMRIAFGNYNQLSKTSKWTTQLKHAEIYDSDDWETNVKYEAKATPIRLKKIYNQGKEKVILFAKTKFHSGEYADCRICGQIFSFAVFVKEKNYWKIETVVKDMGEHGSWGELESPTLIKIGNDKYALSFEFGGMNQGYQYSGKYFLEIKDSYTQEILNIFTDEDNSGAVGDNFKDYKVTNSKAEFIKGSNPDYYDVKITIVGKKGVKTGKKYLPKPFSKIILYSYANDKYNLVK